MSKDNVVEFRAPDSIDDPLTELLRQGAKQLIERAVEAELAEHLARYSKRTDDQGRRAVVRNGYLPERDVVTGVGSVTVKVPKVRSRTEERAVFRSALFPPYVRKAKRVEAALPWLYLKGISTGQMQEALEVLVGPDAKGLSAAVVSRLKQQWEADYLAWGKRELVEDGQEMTVLGQKMQYQSVGWYDNDAAHLSPVAPLDEAKRIVPLMGGRDGVLAAAPRPWRRRNTAGPRSW